MEVIYINTNKEILIQSIYNRKIKFILDGDEISMDDIINYLDIINNKSSRSYLILDNTIKSKHFILIYILFNYINGFTSDYDLILRNLNSGEIIYRQKTLHEFVSYDGDFLEIKALTNVKKDKGVLSKIPNRGLYEIIILNKNKKTDFDLDYSKSKSLDSKINMINNKQLFDSLELKKDCLLNNLDNEIIIVSSMTKSDIFKLFESASIMVDDIELKLSEFVPIDFISIYGNKENILKSSIHENNLIRITNTIYQANETLRNNQKKTKILFADKESYFLLNDNIIDYQFSDIFYNENVTNLIILNNCNDINNIDKIFNDFNIDNTYVLLDSDINSELKVETINAIDIILNSYIENILSSIKNISRYRNILDLIDSFIIYAKKLLNYSCYYYCLPLSILNTDSKINSFMNELLDRLYDIYEQLNLYPDIKDDIDIILSNLLEIQYHLEDCNLKYKKLLDCDLNEDVLIVCKDEYIKNVLLSIDDIFKSNSMVLSYNELIKNNEFYCGRYKEIIYLSIFKLNKFEFIQNNIAPLKKFILSSNQEIRLYNRIIDEYKKNVRHLKDNSKFFIEDIHYESLINLNEKNIELNKFSVEDTDADIDIDIDTDDDIFEDEISNIFNFPNLIYKKSNSSNISSSENSNVKVCKKYLFKENKYMFVGNNTKLSILFDDDKYKIVHHKNIKRGDTIISVETSTSNVLISKLFVKYVRCNNEFNHYINILDTAKEAIVEYMNKYDFGYDTISKELESHGFKREPATIKGWVNSYKTIGFREPDFYLIIYKITNSLKLKEVLDDCYKSEEMLRNLKTEFRLNIMYHLILNLKFNEEINLEYKKYFDSSDIKELQENIDDFIHIETILDINMINTVKSALDIGRVLVN